MYAVNKFSNLVIDFPETVPRLYKNEC